MLGILAWGSKKIKKIKHFTYDKLSSDDAHADETYCIWTTIILTISKFVSLNSFDNSRAKKNK